MPVLNLFIIYFIYYVYNLTVTVMARVLEFIIENRVIGGPNIYHLEFALEY